MRKRFKPIYFSRALACIVRPGAGRHDACSLSFVYCRRQSVTLPNGKTSSQLFHHCLVRKLGDFVRKYLL